jgi:hypothetical protein
VISRRLHIAEPPLDPALAVKRTAAGQVHRLLNGADRGSPLIVPPMKVRFVVSSAMSSPDRSDHIGMGARPRTARHSLETV